MNVDDLFKEKYNDWREVAKRLLIKYNHFNEQEARSTIMVNEAYIYVSNIIQEGDEKYIESIVVQNMINQINWRIGSRGDMKKEWSTNNELFDNDIIEKIEDEEYIEDDYEEKLKHLEKKVDRLDAAGKRLYDLAIIGPYNTSDKLAKYTGISKTTSSKLIRDMRFYLRDGYK